MKLDFVLALPALIGIGVLPATYPTHAHPVARIHVDPLTPRAVHLLVYSSGNAAFAVGLDTVRLRRDTLRITTPTNIVVDLNDGDLHVVSTDAQDVRLKATLTDAPAAHLGAVGRHIVIERGGTGVRPQR